MDLKKRRSVSLMEPMKYLEELLVRYPVLTSVKAEIKEAYEILENCYENGGKLLIAGNGGSCADAEHIVGELMKGFVKRRAVSEEFAQKLLEADPVRGKELADKLQGGLPAIALTGHPGLSTAFLNDVDGSFIYAQQTYGYGKKGDVLLGISTSGNSQNIMYAMAAARAMGMKTIGLTGRDGGQLKETADTAIVVPENETFKIQELHLPVYHALCLMLEERFF
jgi:D-sedoheptulose 7-phosphate isomerase